MKIKVSLWVFGELAKDISSHDNKSKRLRELAEIGLKTVKGGQTLTEMTSTRQRLQENKKLNNKDYLTKKLLSNFN